MWTFVGRRLIAVPPLLLVVSFLTYLLMWAAPGDYYSRFAEDPTVSKETIAELRAKAGLDKGPVLGWATWAGHACTGEFGQSLEKDRPVLSLVAERLFNTLLLSEEAGRTTITQRMLYPSREARDAALKTGMADGVSESFDRLDEYFATLA